MHIEISSKGFSTTEAMREHITSHIESALHAVADRLTRIEVHLGDTNASKGGPDDKRCMIEARPKGGDPIAVEHFGSDVYDTVEETASKLRRALQTKFEKQDA